MTVPPVAAFPVVSEETDAIFGEELAGSVGLCRLHPRASRGRTSNQGAHRRAGEGRAMANLLERKKTLKFDYGYIWEDRQAAARRGGIYGRITTFSASRR